MLPLLMASISAILTSYFFFGSSTIIPFVLQNNFTISEVPFYIVLGCICALGSIYFTNIYFRIYKIFSSIKNTFLRILLAGTSLGVLLYFIPPLYGEGYGVINHLLSENYQEALQTNFFNEFLDNIWVVILLLTGLVIFKIVATSLTFVAGGVGGIFAPVLFMGSALGHCFALIVNHLDFLNKPISTGSFTMVGMAGMMAGVLHAPLTAIFLIAELTGGYQLFVPLMITALISYLITQSFQPHSVYTMELAKRGELLTHDKDKNVLTLMDIQQVVEDNFEVLDNEMNLGQIVSEGVVKSKRNIFPVVDKDHLFQGIILLDDIRTIMFDKTLYEEMRVSDLMQNAPDIIDLNECKMRDIMQKFQDTGAWNLPVVRDKKYVGFISKSKLLTAYRQKLIEVTV